MCIELARRRVDAVQLFDRIGGATDVSNLPVYLSFDVSNMEKHILNEKELRIIRTRFRAASGGRRPLARFRFRGILGGNFFENNGVTDKRTDY